MEIYSGNPKGVANAIYPDNEDHACGVACCGSDYPLGGVIDKFVMALIFGIIFYEIGFLEPKILTRANSEGFTLLLCWCPFS